MVASQQTTPLRPRLLYVATDGMTAELLMAGQLGWLASQGFEVAVAAAGGDALQRVAAREGVRTFEIPFAREISPMQDLHALRRMGQCLREFRPHLINVGTPKASLLGLVAARIAGVPSRTYLQRGLRLETTSGLKRRILAACERLAASSAHHVVCVSDSLRSALSHEKLVESSKLRVLGAGSSNGVDCQRFVETAGLREEADALRKAWSIPAEAPVIGFVGRLTRDKGLADLAQAYTEIVRTVPETHLVIVGPEEAGDPIQQDAVAKLREDARVHFVGRQHEVAPWHRLFDVLAFPSYREGLPNVPLEAAASGRPVVGYEATGVVDAVRHGVTGTLVTLGNWRQLGAALRAYLSNSELRENHGRSGREFVRDHYSRETVWRRWLEFYSTELNRIGIPIPETARITRESGIGLRRAA